MRLHGRKKARAQNLSHRQRLTHGNEWQLLHRHHTHQFLLTKTADDLLRDLATQTFLDPTEVELRSVVTEDLLEDDLQVQAPTV